MEGLVHAAYVLARMHYCLTSLLSSDLLTASERTQAKLDMNRHHGCFCKALDTIQREARFTPEGVEIFDGAVDYMKTVDLLPA